MEKNSKYDCFANYLRQMECNILKLSFEEIEEILGFKLAQSFYQHPALWANSLSHPFSSVWIKAGYRSEQLNLRERSIIFKKVADQAAYIPGKEKNFKKQNSTMTAEFALWLIRDYFYELQRDAHSRYLSWEHCYQVFFEKRGKTDEETLDYLALHLAFYLASWGMYRGSSFLLQKDYRVHIPVVKVIQEPRYDPLLGISATQLCLPENLKLVEEIGREISKCYGEKNLVSVNDENSDPTDTLVTKILLGTLGCVPAFDSLYTKSVKKYHLSSGTYNSSSVYAVAKFYSDNMKEFEPLRLEMSKGTIEYPPMKLMDMCFWRDGYIEWKDKKAK